MAWIQLLGQSAAPLVSEVASRASARIAAGQYTAETPENVARLVTGIIGAQRSSGAFSDREIELLRRLCQSFDVSFRPVEISSHRPIVGPFIVGIKRILFRILRPLMEPVIRQQQDFNSAVIALLLEERMSSHSKE